MLCCGRDRPLAKPGSCRPNASGTISKRRSAEREQRALPAQAADQAFSTGTIRNWPNEPAAAATPIAQERFSGAMLRPITP